MQFNKITKVNDVRVTYGFLEIKNLVGFYNKPMCYITKTHVRLFTGKDLHQKDCNVVNIDSRTPIHTEVKPINTMFNVTNSTNTFKSKQSTAPVEVHAGATRPVDDNITTEASTPTVVNNCINNTLQVKKINKYRLSKAKAIAAAEAKRNKPRRLTKTDRKLLNDAIAATKAKQIDPKSGKVVVDKNKPNAVVNKKKT